MIRCLFVFCLLSCLVSVAMAQDSPEPYRVPEDTMQRLLIHKVNPAPEREPNVRIAGAVVLKAVISKTGEVESLEFISGHPMLVARAIEAVKQWKYRPYELNGIPVSVQTTVRVEFSNESGDSGSASGPETARHRPPVWEKEPQAHIVKRVPPVYPPLARQARIQGTVVLQVLIDKEGNVTNAQLISGHPMLAPAAIEAVKQWKYVPFDLNGETVEVETTVQVNFTLAGGPPTGIDGDAPGGSGGVIGSVPAGPPPALGVEHVPESVIRPLRINKIDPVYPAEALQQGVQGTVLVNARIDVEGKVEGVFRVSGHPMLLAAAMEAVKQWKYIPYEKNGKLMPVATVVQLMFSVENGEGVISEPDPIVQEPIAPRMGVPQRVRVSSGVSSGLLIRKVQPIYPPEAREEHIQGKVLLHVNIDKEGNVSNLELISGDSALAPAAIDAVKQWKYRPYLLNGEAIEVDTQVLINFTLAQ